MHISCCCCRPTPLSVYMCFRSTFHWMVWLVFVLVLLLFPSNRTQQKLYPAEEMRACSMWCHGVSGAFAPQNGPQKCDNASHQASKLSLHCNGWCWSVHLRMTLSCGCVGMPKIDRSLVSILSFWSSVSVDPRWKSMRYAQNTQTHTQKHTFAMSSDGTERRECETAQRKAHHKDANEVFTREAARISRLWLSVERNHLSIPGRGGSKTTTWRFCVSVSVSITNFVVVHCFSFSLTRSLSLSPVSNVAKYLCRGVY